MCEITKLVIAPTKGSRLSVVRLTLTEQGIDGDCHAGRQISLVSGEAVYAMRDFAGNCAQRFFANIVTLGMDYAQIKEGMHLHIEDAVLQVTSVGKRCHDICKMRASSDECPLRRGCAFANVVHGGTIGVGSSVSESSL
ncbi:MAG: hypothetical protein RR232_08390 [Clostridia bacterium]